MVAKSKMTALVLMLRFVRGDSLYTYEQFGVDRKLYVEVMISITFVLQGMKKIIKLI